MAPADAPDVADGKSAQHLFDILLSVHAAAAVEFGVLFAELAGDLGQRLGGSDAQADGNTRVAAHGAGDPPTELAERAGIRLVEAKKCFVDGIDLRAGHQRPQGVHHPLRHIPVKHEIGGEDRYAAARGQLPDLKIGHAHPDPEGFGFVRAGDHAAVVVREHDHGTPRERRVEHPFARSVEVVAVGKSVHRSAIRGIKKRKKAARHCLPHKNFRTHVPEPPAGIAKRRHGRSIRRPRCHVPRYRPTFFTTKVTTPQTEKSFSGVTSIIS